MTFVQKSFFCFFSGVDELLGDLENAGVGPNEAKNEDVINLVRYFQFFNHSFDETGFFMSILNTSIFVRFNGKVSISINKLMVTFCEF